MSTKKIDAINEDECVKKINSLEKKIKTLKKEVKTLKQGLKEKEEKLLRSYADLQNYKKRMEKEMQLKEDEIKKRYISELVDLNELLKKVYEDNNPKDGLRVILGNIKNFFEKEQIKYIESVGKQFDHNLHHAVTTVEKNDCEDGLIIDEVKKGYMVGDKVFRPSHVIVAKKKK
ncbi:MAG: nucleotide exchange factor GrpE [Thermoplasmata archaeon]|nr:MAG: nucleotide exchange factor GrpE [Thermoplasmata archaeon]MCD6468267.1 nucleotide exchange factor GrpE [Thermoplasmata archaeon]RLF26302.1 MAG: nucleotide exchange factor GrpE [Thermoplasmata archaeon]